MSTRYQLRDNLNNIIETAPELQNNSAAIFTTVNTFPATISDKLPLVLWLGFRDGSAYNTSSPSNPTNTLIVEGHFFLSSANERLQTINDIDLLTLMDAVSETFLARLQLQDNECCKVSDIVGNASVQITTGINSAMRYPLAGNANLFWGFILQLQIPIRKEIKLRC